MRGRVQGFQGDRLAEARRVRGLASNSLAELVGVSPQTISNYENGRGGPSAETFDRIGAVLNLPATFFLDESDDVDDSAAQVFYRSMSAATKQARDRADGKLSWLHRIVHYIEQSVALPDVNLPQSQSSWQDLQLADIEELATEVRRAWQVPSGPIGNLVAAAENHGIVCARDSLGAATLEALSQPRPERPVVLVGTDKGTAVRWRFDVAHEIGHLIMHRDVSKAVLRNSAQFKSIEQQAHRFAGALLLPIDEFADDLVSLTPEALKAIKPKWGASVALMIRRLSDGNIISDEQYRSLMIRLSRRGWRKHEPYDDDLPVEQPALLRSAVELILRENVRTPHQIVHDLRLAATDIEGLCNLESGTLDEHAVERMADVIQLRPT